MELLDHIVKTVEDKMKNNISFDDALGIAHKNFGNSMKIVHNTGVEYSIFSNGSGYQNLMVQKRKETNKKYRNQYFREVLNLFKSPKSIALICILILFEYILMDNFSLELFKRIILILILIPSIILIFLSFRQSFIKNKSINLEYANFYSGFSTLLIFPLFNFISGIDFFQNSDLNKTLLLAITSILYILLTYAGFKVFMACQKEYNHIQNKLKKT
ncbi:MAG: hypothetical protein WBN50_07560 [Lutimonas sp.]